MSDEGIYFNEEAERCVLGALLLNWKSMSGIEGEVREEDFHCFYNRTIYGVMKDLFRNGKNCDFVLLKDELESRNLLDKAGGICYITSLCDAVPTSANIMHYVEILRRCSIKRDLLSLSRVTQECLSDHRDSHEIIERIEKTVLEISSRNSTSRIYDSRKLMEEGLEAIRDRMMNFGTVYGVPSGFERLDEMFAGGFQNGQYYVIGARPSIGKTSLALSMMENMAGMGYSVGLISLEMTAVQLCRRLLSQKTGISGTRYQTGQINREDFSRTMKDASEYMGEKIFITESYNASISEVRSLARYLVYMRKVNIVFIDYLGLIRAENDGQYWEQSRYISKSLFALSHELNIPVVALCQLNNDAEDREPSLVNLRGSSDIANDADNVVFLHGLREIPRGEKDYRDEPELDRVLIVEKNRQGPLGRVPLKFQKRLTKFVSA